MSDETVRQAEIAVFDGAAAPWDMVAVRPAGNGAFEIFLIAPEGRQMAVVDWLPGSGVSARSVALDAEVPDEMLTGSVAGRVLVVSDSQQTVMIDISTGTVRRVAGIEGPTVITPDGRRLIWATDNGLLQMNVWQDERQETPFASWIEPLLVADFDSPDVMHILSGEGGGPFALMIGCYGSTHFAWPRDGDDRFIQERTIWTDPLPYDPIYFAQPGPVAAPAGQRLVYCIDQGGCGLIAINGAAGWEFVAEFDEPNHYGRVGFVRPSLDAHGCIVLLRSGTKLLWYPGAEPRPVEFAHYPPLVWHAGFALVPFDDGAGIREIPFTPWTQWKG